ncbi:DJ-1/PfpI family protein [Pacificimonas sp. WHA3]|uniref:DJ-1/PfpI family protein n=1 Tax=Pacificimonas pallii TaxID=2827236 RepID=A0ABS6SEI9_9SPHN|nr:DJ-1/PfpI family protein [Pacificimonas pallii]MBV7256277.1 DJ-1/PfpI family protein [Pacificimonas pallii]
MPDAFHIGFLPYADMTQLDMTGPVQVLGGMPGARLHFIGRDMSPIVDDLGLGFSPTVTMADCPPLDMICVPGGFGCIALMRDEDVLSWLRKQAESAKFITSVCTGSLILAAAGLLQGRRATSHWAWRDQLALFGAIPVEERVVEDGRFITGGGVTAGIDFGFRIIERLHGRDVAEVVQLALEYDPAPLGGGTPVTARPEIYHMAEAAMGVRGQADRLAEIREIAAARQGGAR